MKISIEEVAKINKLAKLILDPTQVKNLVVELNKILFNMDKLANLNTEGIPPTYHILTMNGTLREDLVQPSLSLKDFFVNAPATNSDDKLIVPRII